MCKYCEINLFFASNLLVSPRAADVTKYILKYSMIELLIQELAH